MAHATLPICFLDVHIMLNKTNLSRAPHENIGAFQELSTWLQNVARQAAAMGVARVPVTGPVDVGPNFIC